MNSKTRQKTGSMADGPQDGTSAAAQDRTSATAGKRPGRLADTEHVVIDKSGRMVLPAKLRRALGIQGRTELVASLQGDSIRLRTVDAALERLRGLAMRKRADSARGRESAVDAFIAGRRGGTEDE